MIDSEKRRLVFEQFLQEEELRFSELEKRTGLRSNDLAYYLQKMVSEEILVKTDDTYKLSVQAEKFLPFFQSEGKLSPLVVVLVRVEYQGSILYHKRQKRPYNGLWSLPGGRLLLGETVQQAAERIAKEKTFVNIQYLGVKTTMNEQVLDESGVKHGFFLVVVDATTNEPLDETELRRWWLPEKIPEEHTIPSDYNIGVGCPQVHTEIQHSTS